MIQPTSRWLSLSVVRGETYTRQVVLDLVSIIKASREKEEKYVWCAHIIYQAQRRMEKWSWNEPDLRESFLNDLTRDCRVCAAPTAITLVARFFCARTNSFWKNFPIARKLRQSNIFRPENEMESSLTRYSLTFSFDIVGGCLVVDSHAIKINY